MTTKYLGHFDLATWQTWVDLTTRDHVRFVTLMDGLQQELAVYNQTRQPMVNLLADDRGSAQGEDRHIMYGSVQSSAMRPWAERSISGGEVTAKYWTWNIPLVAKQLYAVEMTTHYVKTSNSAGLMKMMASVRDQAYLFERRLMIESLFKNTNTALVDSFDSKLSLTGKPLFNNDADRIPVPYLSNTFASSHQHYIGSATSALDAAATNALVLLLREHGYENVALVMGEAAYATMRGITGYSDFTVVRPVTPNQPPYNQSGQTPARTGDAYRNTYAGISGWDHRGTYNGVYGTVDIVVTPEVPANYVLAVTKDKKPLATVDPTIASLSGIQQNTFTMGKSQIWGLEYARGCTVAEPAAAAVLYFASTSYTIPTWSWGTVLS